MQVVGISGAAVAPADPRRRSGPRLMTCVLLAICSRRGGGGGGGGGTGPGGDESPTMVDAAPAGAHALSLKCTCFCLRTF